MAVTVTAIHVSGAPEDDGRVSAFGRSGDDGLDWYAAARPGPTAMMRAVGLALHAVRTAFAWCAIVLFVYMVGAIFVQVIGRYVFNFSIAGAEETATFAQIWMVLFGAGIAMRRRQHVGIDVLIALCPAPVQRVALILSSLVGLWFLWVVFSGSFALIEIGKIMRSPALQWPMAIPYLALPIGIAYFALEFAIALVPRWFGAAPPSADEPLADRL